MTNLELLSMVAGNFPQNRCNVRSRRNIERDVVITTDYRFPNVNANRWVFEIN